MAYRFTLYVPTSSKPLHSDHRLAVISWKKPRDADANYRIPPALCISIPRLTLTVEPACLHSALLGAYEAMQNDYLRETITEVATALRSDYEVTADQLLPSTIAAWNATKAGRLNGEAIEAFFNAELADRFATALANKLGVTDPTQLTTELVTRIDAATADQRLKFKKLAGPQTRYVDPVTSGLLRTLALYTGTSEIAEKLNTRLLSFKVETPTSLLDSI